MKIKTSELTGAALDWAVAKCEGISTTEFLALHSLPETGAFWKYRYSSDWAQGGPIIEREAMCISRTNKTREEPWAAYIAGYYWVDGPTPLIAAMRCFAASKLGEDIEVPKELL